MKEFDASDLKSLYRPPKDSHKGQNGKVLVIGGSELFHASIFWCADVASRVVDLVHFCSPANENNEVVRKRLKEGFWNGIVVDWSDVENYIEEDDVVVIGPGMPRDDGLGKGERPTGEIVNELLKKYPDKKWVVDGGALQECSVGLLSERMVLTPHIGEFKRILDKFENSKLKTKNQSLNLKSFESLLESKDFEGVAAFVRDFSKVFGGVVLLKGVEGKDVVCRGEDRFVIRGGNEGLTKGGTGDILAGLTGAFYAKSDGLFSAAAASFVLKRAADSLYARVGVNYNSSDLVNEIPRVMSILMNE